MMEEGSSARAGAVFVSYASEDTEAVQRICEAHGGELAIQTAAGHGLVAAIVLPASLQFQQAELKHA